VPGPESAGVGDGRVEAGGGAEGAQVPGVLRGLQPLRSGGHGQRLKGRGAQGKTSPCCNNITRIISHA
jgi:hypothetical protein